MNYIYDILVNFNNIPYEFYDWNKTDNVRHIKKIPIIKISNKNYNAIKNNQVEFDKIFLDKIYNKTEEYHYKKYEYCCLITNGVEVIGINIDKKIKYTKLLLDEETEIINIVDHLQTKEIKFKIKSKNTIDLYKTRKQVEYIKTARDNLNQLIKENNMEKLKYLYYECFNKKIDSIEEIINKLNQTIEKESIINTINTLMNLKNV